MCCVSQPGDITALASHHHHLDTLVPSVCCLRLVKQSSRSWLTSLLLLGAHSPVLLVQGWEALQPHLGKDCSCCRAFIFLLLLFRQPGRQRNLHWRDCMSSYFMHVVLQAWEAEQPALAEELKAYQAAAAAEWADLQGWRQPAPEHPGTAKDPTAATGRGEATAGPSGVKSAPNGESLAADANGQAQADAAHATAQAAGPEAGAQAAAAQAETQAADAEAEAQAAAAMPLRLSLSRKLFGAELGAGGPPLSAREAPLLPVLRLMQCQALPVYDHLRASHLQQAAILTAAAQQGLPPPADPAEWLEAQEAAMAAEQAAWEAQISAAAGSGGVPDAAAGEQAGCEWPPGDAAAESEAATAEQIRQALGPSQETLMPPDLTGLFGSGLEPVWDPSCKAYMAARVSRVIGVRLPEAISRLLGTAVKAMGAELEKGAEAAGDVTTGAVLSVSAEMGCWVGL